MTSWQILAAFAATVSALVGLMLFTVKAVRLHAKEQLLEMAQQFVRKQDLQQVKAEIMQELHYLRERLDKFLNQNDYKVRPH